MKEFVLQQTIIRMHRPESFLLVGIDGLGGAGKSTIAAALADMLQNIGYPVLLLHIDHFIHPRAVRYNPDYPEWECYYRLQWRYDYLLDEILLPLKSGETLHKKIELYQLEKDAYSPMKIHIPAGCIVIVEGIFLQRPELAGVFDLMAYVDVPEEIRLQRVLLRDSYIGDSAAIAAKYKNRYFPAENYYIQKCHPAESADIIIS